MVETMFSQLPQLVRNQAVLDNLYRHGNRLSGTHKLLTISVSCYAEVKMFDVSLSSSVSDHTLLCDLKIGDSLVLLLHNHYHNWIL